MQMVTDWLSWIRRSTGEGPVGPTQAEQRLQERQAADKCMTGKGYALVPAGK